MDSKLLESLLLVLVGIEIGFILSYAIIHEWEQPIGLLLWLGIAAPLVIVLFVWKFAK